MGADLAAAQFAGSVHKVTPPPAQRPPASWNPASSLSPAVHLWIEHAPAFLKKLHEATKTHPSCFTILLNSSLWRDPHVSSGCSGVISALAGAQSSLHAPASSPSPSPQATPQTYPFSFQLLQNFLKLQLVPCIRSHEGHFI